VSSLVDPALPELSSSAAGGSALPQSRSTGATTNKSAGRIRKRRNSQISTTIVRGPQNALCQPSVDTTIEEVRGTRAVPTATGAKPPGGPPVRRNTKKARTCTESAMPKFSLPTRTCDPETILPQCAARAKVGMRWASSNAFQEAPAAHTSSVATPELVSAEIAELLKPMTDSEDEGEGDDEPTLAYATVVSDSEPRELTEAVASRYYELTSMLRAQFDQQNEVQERLKASLETQKKTVQQQEDFEKAEGWGDRSRQGRTRSSGGVRGDGPDLLEFLRAKAKEDH